jgi:hypothetical protein
MQSPEALAAALSLLEKPQLARFARRSPLPAGMTTLLEAAAGDAEATMLAAAATGRSESIIRKAAGFFIEQVLLDPQSDSYRILGSTRNTPEAGLRRHMALLMRWLHPDLVAPGASGQRFDRSAYAGRVTEAWESLKTPDRRAAYDASLTANAKPGSAGPTPLTIKRRRRQRVRRREGFLNRLLFLLAGE